MRYYTGCLMNMDSMIQTIYGKPYKHRKKYWYNISNSFDIETTSFYENDISKKAIMYVWQWAVGTEFVIYGRTWDEFLEWVTYLHRVLELGDEKRIVCYVHNLAFETQFIRNYFNISEMLALKPYKPIKYMTSAGIEFRCSYILSGRSLDSLSKDYKLKYFKKADYDYKLMRNSQTELTESEIDYIISDVLAVNEYIGIKIKEYNKISLIPNTSTSEVRKYTQRECLPYTHMGGNDNHGAYRYYKMIHALNLEPDEFKLAHECYAGGLTHSNAKHTNKTLYNVGSMDFTSSYPYVACCSAEFPVSKGKYVMDISKDEFYHYIDYYACIFTITFYNLRSKTKNENYISLNKCRHITSDRIVNNGRIVSAKCLEISITHIDFKCVEKFYEWDNMSVAEFWYYKKGFLPKKLVTTILNLYAEKTKLKGLKSDDGSVELQYLRLKGYVNSIYGMMVMNPLKDKVNIIDGEWIEEPVNVEDGIAKYNNDRNRFLFYLWGVYISSIAKSNLVMYGILPLGDDYVYCDTDSVKFLNPDKHRIKFAKYNAMVMQKIQRISKQRRIDINLFMPMSSKGEMQVIGFWSDEGVYDKFKTCGAKRYIVEKDGKLEITVAGLNKKAGAEYLEKNFTNPFDAFTDSLYIPAGCTGKQTHTYCDYEIEGEMEDYQGHIAKYKELSFIHLDDADYDFSIEQNYIDYLIGVQNEIIK